MRDRPGLTLVRSLIARAVADGPYEAARIAADRWGSGSMEVAVTRASVPGSDLGAAVAAQSAEAEFVEAAEALSALGRMTGVRRVAPDAPILPSDGNVVARFVREGRSIPMSAVALTPTYLRPLKVGALLVANREQLRAPGADELLRRDLLAAVARATDAALFAYSFAGDGTTPAGLLHGAARITASDDPHADLADMLAANTSALRSSCWLGSAASAADLALALRGTGLGADLGALGGTLLGLPVYTTDAEEADSMGPALQLVDSAGVMVTDSGITFALSDAGHLSFTDNAPGDVFEPTSNGTSISLFQVDAIAVRVVRSINWTATRPGLVLEGVGAYSQGSA
jgi:HK97 family phage major capsid protein